jgi:hypothetical protein
LYVALDQKYISEDQFRSLFEQAQKVRAKIGGFIKYLLSSTKDNPRLRAKRPRTGVDPTKDEQTKD